MDLARVQANRYKLFSVGALGTFMATLDGSILNVALPSIARDLNAPVNLVAWVVLAYSLTLISLLVAFGAWTERRGYSFAYRFGYAFFIVGSILCAVSNGIEMLIVSRVIQAMGTAMFASVGPGMVTTVFPAEERGKGLGIMVMMVSAGFMVGPPLGGYLLGVWSWHAIFVVNIPIGIVGLVMAHRYFSLLDRPKDPPPMRLAAAAALALGLVSGVFGLSLIDDYALSHPAMWGIGLFSLLAFLTFFRLEKSPAHTVVGLDIFRNRRFTTSLAAQLAHFAGLSGVLILIPFYLEQVKFLGPKEVGMYLVIMPIMMFVVAPLSGKLSDKIGFRLLTSSGMIIMAAGLWLMSSLNPSTENWYVALCLVVVGAGVGIFSTPNASALMGSVGEKRRSVASGILATNRNIGMSVGVAVATALFAFLQQKNAFLSDTGLIFTESYRPVIYVAMGFALVGLVFCLIRDNRSPAEHG
ncbi:MAG: MFS transporter [bacterium]|nr:MFS transporter [bacterium]